MKGYEAYTYYSEALGREVKLGQTPPIFAEDALLESIKAMRNPADCSTLPKNLLDTTKHTPKELLPEHFQIDFGSNTNIYIPTYTCNKINGSLLMHDQLHLLIGEIFGVPNDTDFPFIFPTLELTYSRIQNHNSLYSMNRNHIIQMLRPHITKIYENQYEKYKILTTIKTLLRTTPNFRLIWDYFKLNQLDKKKVGIGLLFNSDLDKSIKSNESNHSKTKTKANERLEQVVLESVRWNLFYLLYRGILLEEEGYIDQYLEAMRKNLPIPFLSYQVSQSIDRIKHSCFTASDEDFKRFYRDKLFQKDQIMSWMVERNIKVLTDFSGIYNDLIKSGRIEGTLPHEF
jgi:hypothetical protein